VDINALFLFFLHSLKLECEKLASEKIEIQRHYVMVSREKDKNVEKGQRVLLIHTHHIYAHAHKAIYESSCRCSQIKMHSFSSRLNSGDIARSRSSCFNSREIEKNLKKEGGKLLKNRFDFTEMNFRYARQRDCNAFILYVGVQLKGKWYTDLQRNVRGIISERLDER